MCFLVAPGDVFPHLAAPLALLVLSNVEYLFRAENCNTFLCKYRISFCIYFDSAVVRLVAARGVYLVLVDEAPALDEPSRRPAVPQLAGLVAVAPSAAADVLVGLRGKVRQFVL